MSTVVFPLTGQFLLVLITRWQRKEEKSRDSVRQSSQSTCKNNGRHGSPHGRRWYGRVARLQDTWQEGQEVKISQISLMVKHDFYLTWIMTHYYHSLDNNELKHIFMYCAPVSNPELTLCSFNLLDTKFNTYNDNDIYSFFFFYQRKKLKKIP